MMTCARTILVAVTSVSLAAFAGCGAVAGRAIDPRADQALKSMSDLLGAAEAISFQAEGIMDRVLETGQLAQYSRSSKVLLVRPDRLRVDTSGDDVSRSAWYDGRTVTILDKRTQTYAAVTTPKTVEKMLDFVIDEYGLTLPVADLMFRDPHKTLVANVTSGSYVGLHSVGEHPCHHLAFRQEGVDWQIWIDSGEKPVPRKLVITYKLEAGHPTYTVTMDKWNLSPKHSAGMFAFEAPAGAKRVEMRELLGLAEGE